VGTSFANGWPCNVQDVSGSLVHMMMSEMLFIEIAHSVQVASTSGTVTPAMVSGYFARGSY
jgi:hypothetical protein